MSQLSFAVPSKGRLKEQCESYFADAGLEMAAATGARGYSGVMPAAPDVDLQFRSASEIAANIVSGEIHLGVTGADLLHEAVGDLGRYAFMLLPLGFGHADIVVAAPEAWLDVETMADLDDVAAIHEARTGSRLRVATKYVRQTRTYFDRCGVGHYRIVESAGATEGLPAAGGAEVIVDITSTGATLAGNGLKILADGVIRRSEAWLCASLTADWSDEALDALARLLREVDARDVGRRSSVVEFDAAFEVSGIDGLRLDLISPGVGVAPTAEAEEVARRLTELGAGDVRLSRRDFVYSGNNVRMDEFRAALGAKLSGEN